MQGLTRKLFDELLKQHAYTVALAMETAAQPFYQQARDTCAPATASTQSLHLFTSCRHVLPEQNGSSLV